MEAVAAAHRAAWDYAAKNEERWIHSFMAECGLDRKLGILIKSCWDFDAGSQAVAQLLASEPQERAAAFAFSIYPAVACGKLPIGAEGTNDLGKVATPILSVDGTINWQERLSKSDTAHPEMERFADIDRVGAYAAREAAVRGVRSGADECLVRLAYAPDHAGPLDIFYKMSGKRERQRPEFFSHPQMASRYPATTISAALAQGRHFLDETVRWNG